MKFSEQCLRSWVNPPVSTHELVIQLTQLGLEVESIDAGVIDLSVPPNRGDCLSIMGIARELSALTRIPMNMVSMAPVVPIINDTLTIKIEDSNACPKYLSRIIKNINIQAKTPEWLQKALENAGISRISAVVDITNYVMLELGQPMHAFDLQAIGKEIVVRKAHVGEKIALLDQTEISLQATDLIIADEHKPLALAGIMGGIASSITENTRDIVLECAYFEPIGIRLTARQHKTTTDSAYRFERSIDPELQEQAMARAISLLQEIVGGQPGPVALVINKQTLPGSCQLLLRRERIKKILGICPVNSEVSEILINLGMKCSPISEGWYVIVPTHRQDITREIDLIEEVARFIGYHAIPAIMPQGVLDFKQHSEANTTEFQLKTCLKCRGYSEVITYSFISPELATLFEPTQECLTLINPISSDMSVMRPSLLPGLVKVLQYNENRQCNRMRIFEIGLKFVFDNYHELQQEKMLAGLCVGGVQPEHWDLKSKAHDFFDMKGDIEALAKLVGFNTRLRYEPTLHQVLHPGKSAAIFKGDEYIGFVGELHPKIVTALDLATPVVVFELRCNALKAGEISKFCCISKFPGIRRDLAIIVDEKIIACDIKDVIKESLGDLMQDCCIFDVYCGQGIEFGKKSIGLGIVLQHPARTLVDDEIKQAIAKVIVSLKIKFDANLR